MTEFGASDLATIYPKPAPRVIAKARPEIDSHAKKFIGLSPFCVLATSGSDGSVDASPSRKARRRWKSATRRSCRAIATPDFAGRAPPTGQPNGRPTTPRPLDLVTGVLEYWITRIRG